MVNGMQARRGGNGAGTSDLSPAMVIAAIF